MHEALLNNFRRFASISMDDARAIEALFSYRRFRKRQYIVQEGDIVRFESYIVLGLTRTYEVDADGREHVLQFGFEDWWVGDLYSFLTETPSRYAIDCLEDTDILQISRSNLEELYVRAPVLERCFRILVQNAFIATTRRVAASLTKPAAEQYADFLTQYHQLAGRIPDRQIASYLGITPQSLSRIRSRRN